MRADPEKKLLPLIQKQISAGTEIVEHLATPRGARTGGEAFLDRRLQKKLPSAVQRGVEGLCESALVIIQQWTKNGINRPEQGEPRRMRNGPWR